MLTNCFRFAPHDSVPGLIAKICKYLKDHPGWSAEEIAEEIQKFVESACVESFNGRTGDVVLAADDVNNLRIATAYFAEGDEVINDLDLSTLYKNGIRFVFTNFNTVTSGYDLGYALELFSDDNVVYYPLAVGGGGGSGSVLSVNGKTGTVVLSLGDILGDSGAQVKLCTATEFTSSTIETWNAYYESGFRLICVVNDEATAVDFLYVLKQDVNNHQPIMISSGSGESAVTSVNSMTGAVTIPIVDVSGGDSEDIFAKMFINENEDYPIVPAVDSYKLGGQLPSYYATSERVSQLSEQKANKAGWTADKFLGTDASGNMVVKDAPESGADPLTIYPIGSIYMSVNSTSPAALFGGTWEQLKDRFLLGAGDSYAPGTTGGADKVTLEAKHIPKHDHYIYRGNDKATGTTWESYAPGSGKIGPDNHLFYSGTMPDAQAFSIVNPYLAVNMWKRVY